MANYKTICMEALFTYINIKQFKNNIIIIFSYVLGKYFLILIKITVNLQSIKVYINLSITDIEGYNVP